MTKPSPPQSVNELLCLANQLTGLTLASIALKLNFPLPNSLKHGKGWTGKLLEYLLGSDAGCESQPDFTRLQIELKTLPVDIANKPLESTFITTIPLMDIAGETWLTSGVYRKLQQVLWIPIICPKRNAITERIIGAPLLWSPSPEEAQQLQADWEELTEMICLGELNQITAHHGKYLQIRPKGANAKAVVRGRDEFGEINPTLPRGFYLRASFTRTLLLQRRDLGG